MGETFRISMLAVLVVLFALPLRQEKQSFGFLLGLAMGIGILGIVLMRMQGILQAITVLKEYLGSCGGYLSILLKVLGITYVCEFASSICKDAGYGFVAGQLEILGKLSVMVSGISLLFALIEQIRVLA